VNHNREQGQGRDTKSQWGTELKIAKVANILRLTDTDFTKIWRENEFFIISEYLHKSFN
jgi:hypothetical protein